VAEDRQPERRGAPGHGSAGPHGPGRGRRGVLAAAVAVVLLGLVAVGSLRGPLGSGRGRPSYPADLVDSLILLLVLAMLAAGVLAAIALWTDRRMIGRRPRRGSNFGLLLPMAAVLLLWLFRDLFGLGGGRDDPPATTVPDQSTLETAVPPPDPGVVPLVVAGLALAAMVGLAVAQLLAERRRRRPPRTPGERLVELLDDTLEDLEREPDPRRAVIGAWARMERGLAAAGLPRRPAEAPFEYAGRVLESALAPTDRGTPLGFPGPLRPDSVHRLTGLFERAKFSRHAIGEDHRHEAIAALRAVRRELAEAVEAAAEAEAAARAAGVPGSGGAAQGRAGAGERPRTRSDGP
jgi:hypothetical protein